MTDPVVELSRRGGVAALRDLTAAGVSSGTVRRWAASGRIVRVREGVYATRDCDPDVVTAARIGGRLAGAAAGRFHGLWVPPGGRLVVEVPRGRHADPSAGTRIVRGPTGPPRFGVADIPAIVPQVLRTEPVPFAVAILDSVLRTTPFTEFDLEEAASGVAIRHRRAIRLVDRHAESGTESVVRAALALAGIASRPQVRIPFTDLGRVDLVVGDRLVIECDGAEHHSDPEQLERDNRRDIDLTALGFVVFRVRYRAAMSDIDGVVAAVRRLIADGVAHGGHPGGGGPATVV